MLQGINYGEGVNADPKGWNDVLKLTGGGRGLQEQKKVYSQTQSQKKECYIQEITTNFQLFRTSLTVNSVYQSEREDVRTQTFLMQS